MTAKDVPGVNDVGPAFLGDPIFADGLVEYHGQSIFAVAATSMALAREAAAKGGDRIRNPAADPDHRRGAGGADLRAAHPGHAARRRRRRTGQGAAAPVRADRCRRPGAFLPRRPGRHGDPRRGRRHAGAQLHPASDRGAASGRPRAEAVGPCGGVRDAAHGRRFRRQGVAGVADRGGRGAAGAAHRPAGEAPAGPRRRHDPDRQAPPLPDRLRCRLRQGRPHPGHHVHAGDRLRLFARPVRRHRRPGDVPCRQCVLPGPRPDRFAPLQDQHRVQHRLPRLRRPAGHGRHRARGGRDRPPPAHRSADRAASAISTASATATSRHTT